MRGNVLDMAVGIIIGTAFGKLDASDEEVRLAAQAVGLDRFVQTLEEKDTVR
jgi:large-conductance mechanosensitive channel